MAATRFLQGYAGQGVDELIALAGEYRVDSLVLAFEQALRERADRDGLAALGEAEVTILAVEALEREVNNGGYHQFFLNTPAYAPVIVASLQRIGCPKTAAISAEAVSMLGLRAPFGADDVDRAIQGDDGATLVTTLGERCDAAYFDNDEPIADRLFAYIGANRESVRVGAP